jgi:hypothetical protein
VNAGTSVAENCCKQNEPAPRTCQCLHFSLLIADLGTLNSSIKYAPSSSAQSPCIAISSVSLLTEALHENFFDNSFAAAAGCTSAHECVLSAIAQTQHTTTVVRQAGDGSEKFSLLPLTH